MTTNPTPQEPMPDDEGDLHMSVMDFLWVLSIVSHSVIDDALHVTTGEMLLCKALGLPMNQTVRLPDESFVTIFLLPGDIDAFHRTHG